MMLASYHLFALFVKSFLFIFFLMIVVVVIVVVIVPQAQA